MGIWRGLSPLQRFQSFYRVDDSGCWLWTGSLNTNGYGHTILDGRRRRNR